MAEAKPPTRVLIVEDEPVIVMLLEDMLAELNCSVAGAAMRVEDALAAVEAGGFDIAIVDMNLHGKSGAAVADALVARGQRFMFATGYGAQGVPAEHATAPVLYKPFELGHLQDALRATLA